MHRGGAVTNVNSEIQTVISPNPADLLRLCAKAVDLGGCGVVGLRGSQPPLPAGM